MRLDSGSPTFLPNIATPPPSNPLPNPRSISPFDLIRNHTTILTTHHCQQPWNPPRDHRRIFGGLSSLIPHHLSHSPLSTHDKADITLVLAGARRRAEKETTYQVPPHKPILQAYQTKKAPTHPRTALLTTLSKAKASTLLSLTSTPT